jgi:hypothetical protein
VKPHFLAAGQAFSLLIGALTVNTACEAQRPSDDFEPALIPSRGRPGTSKAVPVHMPGALPEETTVAAAKASSAVPLKNTGKLGERLEGDVYYFELLGLRTCDASGKVAAVEVEIEAKTRLTVSPRDVAIGKGGITFTGGLNFDRQLPGCAPLLGISVLQKGQVTRGFVLFDVPRRPGSDLTLIYQPTRWGGAGYVSVPLQTWPGPP